MTTRIRALGVVIRLERADEFTQAYERAVVDAELHVKVRKAQPREVLCTEFHVVSDEERRSA